MTMLLHVLSHICGWERAVVSWIVPVSDVVDRHLVGRRSERLAVTRPHDLDCSQRRWPVCLRLRLQGLGRWRGLGRGGAEHCGGTQPHAGDFNARRGQNAILGCWIYTVV